MRPLKLTLQAFGSYGKQTLINFEEPNQNLFLITGDTGAGKTTIFDAIVFALYGEASSTANKKDGAELQSQYVRQNVQPFVELTFFEGAGGNPDVYTVRRVPRHQRPRKRGEGMTDEKESVSLTMPDGSEYPQKETDKKLEEIIGLTKNQFMQVAMIAQGEFMELLRAKSDTKKVIFRKLFGTEIFQKIVDELGERKKKKEKEIATIRTVFQTEAAHLRIPEGYERAEELAAFKRRITTAARLSVTDMEELLQELDVLCGALETGERLAYEEYQKASEFRDKKRDAYAGAEHLLKFFRQLEEAEADLAVCQEAEASMKRAKALIGKLRAAYEIRAEFQRYEDARKAEADMRTRRKEQQELLPELERAAGEAKEKEAEKKKLFEQELESFSRILERVEKARKLFDTIRDAQRETVQREKTFRKAESIAEEKRKRLSDLEEQEKVWRRQCDELGDAEKRLALWKVKRMEAEALEKEAREERNQQMEVDGQRRSAKKAKEDYAAASQAYEKENGFLGIMSYNTETKDFIITSKSAMESEYAGWFKDIFYSTTNAKTREGIKFFLEQHNVSAVFEVLDPVHNPHIIDQPKQKIVVLDLVRNTIETEIMPYRVTQLFCFTFGLPCKKLRKTLNTWKEFEDFVNETHNSIRQVEGYVLVDSNGYMLKVKTNYYRTWKYLRTISERVRTGKYIKEQALSSQIMKDFCEWCSNNVEVLGEDITKLRLRFYGDMGEDYDSIY